jgi:hypothetical protein
MITNAAGPAIRSLKRQRDGRASQDERILWLLQSSWPAWTPAPVLAHISLQYCRAIRSLRKRGWLIENKVVIEGGKRHGFYRLAKPFGKLTALARDAQAKLLLTEGQTIAEPKYADPEEGGHE